MRNGPWFETRYGLNTAVKSLRWISTLEKDMGSCHQSEVAQIRTIWTDKLKTAAVRLWSNIHPNSTNEDLLSVSESRDHTGILKPDDARDCLKILSRTDLHTGGLQTSQDQIYQETSNKTADDFWKCNSIENCLYRITQQMKPFRLITGMPRAPGLYNRYFIETFIIRDKVLQDSVSHTFRCSRISINSI